MRMWLLGSVAVGSLILNACNGPVENRMPSPIPPASTEGHRDQAGTQAGDISYAEAPQPQMIDGHLLACTVYFNVVHGDHSVGHPVRLEGSLGLIRAGPELIYASIKLTYRDNPYGPGTRQAPPQMALVANGSDNLQDLVDNVPGSTPGYRIARFRSGAARTRAPMTMLVSTGRVGVMYINPQGAAREVFEVDITGRGPNRHDPEARTSLNQCIRHLAANPTAPTAEG
jgi:hypothetical protein